jgi:poly(A) polymerase
MPSSQRDLALDITRQLRAAGFEALWAGGCVRDQLLGLEPKDYDVATNARPEEVQKLFGKRRTLAIGAAFGVIAVLSKDCNPVEVATFRSDGAYLDGRHPASVVYTTAEHDAERRDFTINGMFFDPLTEQVIDYVDGQADLAAGIVRAIGDPRARFTEDKLRMLRAVRFATTFNFEIDPQTLLAIQEMAHDVNVVSAERINAELTRLLVHSQRGLGLLLLHETALLRSLFPKFAGHADNDSLEWQKTISDLRTLQTENVSTTLAVLFTDLGSASEVAAAGRRLKYSNKEIDLAMWLAKQLPRIAEAEQLPWPRLQRILVHDGARELMALARAVLGENHPGVVRAEECLKLPAEKFNPLPLLTGDELVRHGLEPGPYFAGLLTAVRDAQLEGTISTQAEALNLVEQLLRDKQAN